MGSPMNSRVMHSIFLWIRASPLIYFITESGLRRLSSLSVPITFLSRFSLTSPRRRCWLQHVSPRARLGSQPKAITTDVRWPKPQPTSHAGTHICYFDIYLPVKFTWNQPVHSCMRRGMRTGVSFCQLAAWSLFPLYREKNFSEVAAHTNKTLTVIRIPAGTANGAPQCLDVSSVFKLWVKYNLFLLTWKQHFVMGPCTSSLSSLTWVRSSSWILPSPARHPCITNLAALLLLDVFFSPLNLLYLNASEQPHSLQPTPLCLLAF